MRIDTNDFRRHGEIAPRRWHVQVKNENQVLLDLWVEHGHSFEWKPAPVGVFCGDRFEISITPDGD